MKILAENLSLTTRALVAAALILTAAAALAASPWQGHEDYEDGILTIYNPETPMQELSVIKPEPQWRLGGDDDEAETLFGLVTDAQRTADGTTYLLDAVMSTVYEISPTGEVQRTLGREGDGPGEFRNSSSLILLPENNIGVIEMMPSHMEVLGPDGLPRPGIDLNDGGGGQALVQRVAISGKQIIMGMHTMHFSAGGGESRQVLGSFGLDGSLQHKLLHTAEKQSGGSISISSGDDNDFVNNWVLAANDQVAVYRRTSEYLVEVFATDGSPVRRIRRQYTSLRRPEPEIQDQREQRKRMREQMGITTKIEIEEMARDISLVLSRPNGELWVQSSQGERKNEPGSIGIFDVFDAKGRYVRQTRIEADYDADDDQFLIRGDHLYVLKQAQNAPDRTMSGGGGMMMIQMSSGGGGDDDEDEDEELLPYEVICYKLPTAK